MNVKELLEKGYTIEQIKSIFNTELETAKAAQMKKSDFEAQVEIAVKSLEKLFKVKVNEKEHEILVNYFINYGDALLYSILMQQSSSKLLKYENKNGKVTTSIDGKKVPKNEFEDALFKFLKL